jgi:hypothetical protein
MRMLVLDLDSLRPDHLGCYGYHQETSPNIDEIENDDIPDWLSQEVLEKHQKKL